MGNPGEIYACYVTTVCFVLIFVTSRELSRYQQQMTLCDRKIYVLPGKIPAVEVFLSHSFLDVTAGIVPGLEYSVTTHSGEKLSSDTLIAIISEGGSFHHPTDSTTICGPLNCTLITKVPVGEFFTVTWVPRYKSDHNNTIKITKLLSYSETQWHAESRYYTYRNSCLHLVRSTRESVLSSDFGDLLTLCSHYNLLLESPANGRQLVQFQNLSILQEGIVSVHLNSEREIDFLITSNNVQSHLLKWMLSSSRYMLIGFRSCALCHFRLALSTLYTENGCKATLKTEQGILEHPLPHNCSYRITSNDAEKPLYLVARGLKESGTDFCPNHQISIENAQRKQVTLCPSQDESFSTTYNNELTLHFSAPSIKSTLMYKAVLRCKNDTFTDKTGNVCSLGSHGHCFYTISAPLGYNVDLDILYLEISVNSSDECIHNYVRLIGTGENRIYCGNWTNRTEKVRSLNNSLIIETVIGDPFAQDKKFCAAYHAVATNSSLTACAYGWVSGSYYCYRLFTVPAEWTISNDICGNYGGHLAAVSDQAVGKLLNSILLTSPHLHPSQAVWIGANDLVHENCFEWSDGQPLEYANWFSGWDEYRGYNSQPSDDGLANQDCVELRRNFTYPSKGYGITDSYYWNDRDCTVANPFVCQMPRPGVTVAKYVRPSCNRTINLDLGRDKDVITSPAYPGTYPANVECQVDVAVPKGNRIELQFSDFLLEDQKLCQYDVVRIEDGNEPVASGYCGDWTTRIKLLRYVTKSERLRITFVSDFSHSFRGFRAEVSMKPKKKVQNEEEAVCGSRLFRRHLHRCYLVASYPEVSWDTAERICNETQSELAELATPEEKNFVYSLIRMNDGYMSGVVYWIGARKNPHEDNWKWLSGRLVKSNDFVKTEETFNANRPSCLAIQWRHYNSTSDLFWTGKRCNHSGRYVCKKPAFVLPDKLNTTLTNSTGKLTSVNYPSHYLNNMDYVVTIKAETGRRLVILVNHLEIEWQEDCLYDYIEITSHFEKPGLKLCGTTIDSSRSNYVTDDNVAYLRFHSDYSVTGSGFVITWESVISGNCGVSNDPVPYVTSPRFPNRYLPDQNCRHAFSAGSGNRVLLTFSAFHVGRAGKCTGDYLKVQLSSSAGVTLCGGPEIVPVGYTLLTYEEDAVVNFHAASSNSLGNKGFNLTWQSWNQSSVQSVIYLQGDANGRVRSLNYPNSPPSGINCSQILTAPPGYRLKFTISEANVATACAGRRLIVEDVYGKSWVVCPRTVTNFTISSKLNVLRIISSTARDKRALKYDIPYTTIKDEDFIQETMKISSVYSCLPNPCQHGGKCTGNSNGDSICECPATHTGLFCHLSWCDVRPCGEQGSCHMTKSGYSCECPAGFTGNQCESPITACSSSPCGAHGQCLLTNDTFQCHCQLWYEGSLCERFRFPYKPLSQRMLEEPFWLGLITVFAVLLVILCVYCIKRKFAWKIERLLAEEIEKSKCNPSPPATRYSLSSNQLSLTPGNQSPQNCPKSIFNKFRKHSIRSNTRSPTDREREHGRTFSFDDILRRSTKKIPTPPAETNKNDDEKSRILASLVTSPTTRRMSLDEFIRMSERKIKEAKEEEEQEAGVSEPERTKETSFSARLSPRFARHSAPSFTEFHSIREQSVEYASSSSSESAEDDPKTSEVQVDISPTPMLIPEPVEVKVEKLEVKDSEQLNLPLRQKGGFLEVPNILLSVEPQEPLENEKSENPESLLLRRKPDFLLGRKYSVDLPIPKILVTSNTSSIESDPNSPPRTPNPNKSMTYLAPLTTDRTISESNLSTSGYSSLSSPGLSRCNSSSPISDDVDSQSNNSTGKKVGTTHKGCHGHPKCHQAPPAFIYPVTESGHPPQYKSRTFTNAMWRKPCHHERCARRHSYQTSTDESIDDEGIGMDSIDFKIRKGELKSARELEAYMSTKKAPANGFNSLSSDTPTSSSSTRSSPSLRKGEKNKKAVSKGRKSPVASPLATPVKEALGEAGPHVTPSSDSDQENYPRPKSQTRRLKKDLASSPTSRSRTEGACRRSSSTEKLGSHRQSKYNVLRSSSSTSIPHATSDLADLSTNQENKRPPLLKRSTTDKGNSIDDSVESSLPSDTDEEKQPFEPLIANDAFQSNLRRQEAVLEESDSGESSSETTVLLRKDGDSIPEVEEAGTQTDITSSIVVYHQDEALLEMS